MTVHVITNATNAFSIQQPASVVLLGLRCRPLTPLEPFETSAFQRSVTDCQNAISIMRSSLESPKLLNTIRHGRSQNFFRGEQKCYVGKNFTLFTKQNC